MRYTINGYIDKIPQHIMYFKSEKDRDEYIDKHNARVYKERDWIKEM